MPPTSDVTVVLDANTSDAVSQESGQNLTGKHQTVGGKNLGHVKGKKNLGNFGFSGLECEHSLIEFFFQLEHFQF